MTNTTPAISELRDPTASASKFPWVATVQGLVIAVLFVMVYRPPMMSMVHKWQTDGNWSHGWLVPAFSLYFLVVHRDELFSSRRKPSYVGLALIVASLLLYYGSYLAQFGYPQKLSILPCLMGLILLLCGWQVLKIAWFPIAFLLFAMPLPTTTYFFVTLPLRHVASLAAGALLRLLPDVDAQVKGVVIDYEYQGVPGTLNVEEACSGMRLLMAFCALGVAMAYLGDRPLWHRVVMVVFCIPIAMLCNTIRVFVTGILQVYGYRDWSQGSAHELLGLAMLPIALGLFALVSYVLNNLFVEEPAE